jgi:hypothetical protein
VNRRWLSVECIRVDPGVNLPPPRKLCSESCVKCLIPSSFGNQRELQHANEVHGNGKQQKP